MPSLNLRSLNLKAPPKSLSELFEEDFLEALDPELRMVGTLEMLLGYLEEDLESDLDEAGFDFIGEADDWWSGNWIAFELTFDDRTIEDFNEVIDEWLDARGVADSSDDTSDIDPGLEIQLAWAERKDGAWSAKSVSEEVLATTFIAKQSLVFKSEITGSDILASAAVSEAFDSAALTASGGMISTNTISMGDLLITCYRSRTDIKRLLGTFRFTGCNGRVFVTTFADAPTSEHHILPTSTVPQNMRFVEESGTDVPLELASGSMGRFGDPDYEYITTLSKTPGQFSLVVSHQDEEFLSQQDFFYQDESRVFFVTPEELSVLDKVGHALQDIDLVDFDLSSQGSDYCMASLLIAALSLM